MALLEARHLKKYYTEGHGGTVQAVDDVSFTVEQGKTLGIVGESGCGKSTTGRLLLKLEEVTGGQIFFNGKEITNLSAKQFHPFRRDIQMIFQDPYASLDPRMRVLDLVGEPLLTHKLVKNRADLESQVALLLDAVGLSSASKDKFPHEFSGGQRQRVSIARALALRPRLIVCDEPVSALDVSIQSHVLNLLRALQKEYGLTYIFISHALNVVSHMADTVGVMYLGQMVELAPRAALYTAPRHPYTTALLSSIPQIDESDRKGRVILQGDVPSPMNPPSGCRFHTRCPRSHGRCETVTPEFREVSPGHFVTCHLCGD